MAYVTGNRNTSLTLGNRLGEIFKDMSAAYSAWCVYHRTLRELQGLTNRELNDLGLNPTMLRGIAHEAAYGKRG